MNVRKFKQKEEWVDAIVDEIRGYIRPGMHIGLAGGDLPKSVYQKLADECFEKLEDTELWVLDERVVPLDDPDSNYHMISESGVTDNVQAFHYFNTELPREKMVEEYTEELSLLDDYQFDLVILGIGEGGHIASIFPYSSLITTTKPVGTDLIKSQDISDRVTVTLDVLKRAKHTIVIAEGQADEVILDLLETVIDDEMIEAIPALYLTDIDSVSFYLL